MPNNTLAMRQRLAPWIGIGVSGCWDNSADALRDAELNFTVRQEQLFWQREEQTGGIPIVYNEKAPMFANIRDTDDRLLGCATPQYKIIQNKDAFSLVDPFLGNGGVITNLGMTEDGLCFMVARLQVSRVIGMEPYEINLMLTNSFNGKHPCQIIMTPIRIYCQNMYRKLVKDRLFLAKHTLGANERLIQIAQGNAVEKKVLAFKAVIESSQAKSLTLGKLDTLLAMLFPYPKEGGPREQTFRIKADEQREKFEAIYFDAEDNRKWKSTAFGFINAYYDWLSHRDATRNTSIPWADRRLSGIVSGEDVEQSILREAMR